MSKQPLRIVDYCINIFTKNENQPLYVEDIYSRMRQRHWKSSSENPTKIIGNKLRSDYRFVKVGPNTFKLASKFYKARCKSACV